MNKNKKGNSLNKAMVIKVPKSLETAKILLKKTPPEVQTNQNSVILEYRISTLRVMLLTPSIHAPSRKGYITKLSKEVHSPFVGMDTNNQGFSADHCFLRSDKPTNIIASKL
jgi:hypothetical protein